MLRFFLNLLALLWCMPGFALGDPIVLESGATSILTIAPDSEVDISPKGIIEIESAGKGRLRILALKSGVVRLRARGEGLEQSYVVEVLGRDTAGDWLRRAEWQSFFCRESGVTCEAEKARIVGESSNFRWYFEARRACRGKMPCRWDVSLSEAARRQALDELKALYPEFAFDLNGAGELRLKGSCDEKERSRLEEVVGAIEKLWDIKALVQCERSLPGLWQLEVLVVAERFGSGEASNPLRWERIEIPSDQPLKAYLAELSQNKRMRVVASPEVSLSLGGTAVLRDGQEIQTLAVQKEADEILWKTSGFRLEMKLMEIREDLARIVIRMNLSQPQSGLRTIDASEFASEVWIPRKRMLRVGRMQATLKGEEDYRVPWLSAIPLLGELFRWRSDTEAKSELDVYLRIAPSRFAAEELREDGTDQGNPD